MSSKKQTNWMQRHIQDPFVKQAQQQGKRSRASFKLQQINEKDKILKPGQIILDLGAAPGGWSQIAAQKVGGHGQIIALDLLDMAPINGVTFIKGDFLSEAVQQEIDSLLKQKKADLILSDMAPNMSGIAMVDQSKVMYLAETALDLANDWLKPGGAFLVKLFQGRGVESFHISVRKRFKKTVIRKPEASRSESKEYYLLATGYNV